MDSKKIIANLHPVFCEISKERKRYSKVWLEDADFGGFYHSDLFILNVQMNYKMENSFSEMKDIIYTLAEKAKEESRWIVRVAVYNIDDRIGRVENVVYDMDEVCS